MIFRYLVVSIIFLTIANLLGILAYHSTNSATIKGVQRLFDFNTERNIPTLFSSLLLFSSSIISYTIWHIQRKTEFNHWGWLFLSIAFMFLAFDETVLLHERLWQPINKLLNTSSFFYYAWVIPYGILSLFIFGILIGFLKKIPRSIAQLMLISGIIFVSGAIGLEMIAGWYVEKNALNTIPHQLLYTLEEFLEMFGITFFIFTILKYIAEDLGEFKVKIQ